MKIKKTNGFTLLETLITVSISSVITLFIGIKVLDEARKNEKINFVNEAYEIIKAVDMRVSIDGYSTNAWQQTSWSNESEIVNELIMKELTSQYYTACSGGEWTPSLTEEKKQG